MNAVRDFTIWYVDCLIGSPENILTMHVEMMSPAYADRFVGEGYAIVDVKEGVWS